MNLLFIVQGEAIPQGSKTIAQGGGKVWLRDSNPKLKTWRRNFTYQVLAQLPDGLSFEAHAAVRAVILIYLPKPKTVTRVQPTVKPDVDKLLRAIFDGLTEAKVWHDDSQCVDVRVSKHYCLPGDTPKVFVNLHTAREIPPKLNM